MTKPFFEVFPGLQLTEALSDLFEETEVARIAVNRERSKYAVSIESSHLIHRRDVSAMQETLADRISTGKEITVYIKEQFHLSEQYTLQRLMEEYGDSIAWELWQISPVSGSIFRDAKLTYPTDHVMMVSLEDSCLTRSRGERIRSYIEQILRERCGMDARVELDYHEPSGLRREEAEEAAKLEQERQVQARYVLDALTQEEEARRLEIQEEEQRLDGQEGIRQEEKAAQEKAAEQPQTGVTRTGAAAGSRTLKGNRKKNDFQRGIRRSEDPDVLFGRSIRDDADVTRMEDIVGEIGEVTIRGQILASEFRDIRGDKTIAKFTMTDFTDSIAVKLFLPTLYRGELEGALKKGAFVRVRGVPKYDAYDKEISIQSVAGVMKTADFRTPRKDTAVRKRVELHCHTKMSDMDGISECSDIVKRAYSWGMPAIAITDHGVVQAFPDANHVRQDLLKAENKRRQAEGLEPVDGKDFFKIIYGCEAYIVDDLSKSVMVYEPEHISQRLDEYSMAHGRYVVFDLETTGFSCERDKVIEIGAVKVEDGKITERFSEFVNPEQPIPYRIQKLTNIRDEMVKDAGTIDTVLPAFAAFCEDCVLVGHNVGFDISFIRENITRWNAAHPDQPALKNAFITVDTIGMARTLFPGHRSYNLDAVTKLLNVTLEGHHRAVNDAEATAEVFLKMQEKADQEKNVKTLQEMNDLADASPEVIRSLRRYHCILLAKNDTGRVNLYRMISASHLKYFHTKPIVPKSLLASLREGIIVGSACCLGELYSGILRQLSEEALIRIADFYDYLEIQPRGNNAFMIASEKSDHEQIHSEEDILEINRKIVRLGEQLGKPVVATCDVHFLDPEDSIYREIIMDGGSKDKEDPAPLYLRITDEMLEEFAYLGSEKCQEVVIDNTLKIADQIEVISPVRPDKCPPVIENSDENLRKICYDKAHELYGDPLPEIVEKRLSKELNSIISNGYSVMYIIAQKLVWKSVEDGYLVGSRGSVGSSFVATMAGITEVNPLAPHYYCPHCHFTDFDSPLVMKYQGRCGIDMPARDCPKCGQPLKKDGFDIPFETFLGFKGDKEPDIDLNFSGEYQSKAHAYTKVIFGHEQTFKAGTIATVADKTAYGFVLHYFENRGIQKRRAEIERLAMGCTGIRRSTGQHPGGIVVLPIGEEINTFTPVQHPANDMTTDIITTHFDYHSIDHNLLKLDILGHDDPTMIRMLQDLTGIDPLTIPLDDEKVMGLFCGTEPLGVTPQDIDGITTGTLGVPEFGTKFVMGMLDDTKPSSMSELVRISGLSHGTDVWLGNAQTLIQEGTATLSTAICTRDDIMSYLIMQGVESSMAFKTMESVRKGKGLQPEMEQAMRDAGVPDWYIASCWKIKYMFPRAHAAAYVMMALRIAYCKVYYPLAYYAAYFSIRASAFSYEIMCQGKEKLLETLENYKARRDELTNKELDQLDDMHCVLEMYARGYDFTPIDLFKVGARNFTIHDGKIMPALTSIDGMGEKAADGVVEAAKAGPFLSKDDFRERARVSQTITDKLAELGLLGDLPDSNQISIFDWM